MRDMVTCFSEHAVRISETTCSSIYANHDSHHQLIPCSTPPPPPPAERQQQQISCSTTPENQTAVSSLYKITLSNTRQHLLVTLTWSKRNQTGHHSLTITFSEDKNSTTTTSTSFKLLLTPSTATSRLFRKKKGTKSLEFNPHKIEIIWDFAEAKYNNHYNSSCVEPVDGFYLIVMVDSEVGLMLGDLSGHEIAASRKMNLTMGRFTLVSRKEEHYYSGDDDSSTGAVYSTKARFIEGGDLHQIVIRCCGERDGANKGLSVSVDKSMVMRVKRLQWNFRGNQTVFVDGLLVDLFWDVHDWFFGSGGSTAVFMFRKRCGVETRLWLQQEGEKLVLGGGGGSESSTKSGGGGIEREEKDEFSLLIYASKSC